MLFPGSQRWGGFLLLGTALAGAWSCASEEIPRYGDPARVAGGVGAAGGGTSTGGGGSGGASCQVDATCKVSFKNDVYPALEGMGSCSFSPGCHGDSKGMLTLMPMDAAGFYTAIKQYQMNHAPDVGPYIVPCDPAASKLPCNLKVSDGVNPHKACGSTMPLVSTKAPTLKQLQAIEDWITCGAPNN